MAYPISTFTYAIVPHSAAQKELLQQFLNYAMTTGQTYGAALDFAPLPKVVLGGQEGNRLASEPSSRARSSAGTDFGAAAVRRDEPRRKPARRGGAGRH